MKCSLLQSFLHVWDAQWHGERMLVLPTGCLLLLWARCAVAMGRCWVFVGLPCFLLMLLDLLKRAALL